MSKFQHSQFDPLLLVAQMIAMQSIFYFTFGLWLTLVTFFTNQLDVTLPMIFASHSMDRSELGWFTITASFCNAFSSAVALRYVVARGKLCLDFTCTMYGFHLLISLWYDGWHPLFWWIINIICVVITVVLGEYICMQHELQDIPIVGK
eukprot:Awhi_evm1s677